MIHTGKWLANILNSKKLTSKDKLVATYLLISSRQNKDGTYWGKFQPQRISYFSGLALRTVQKSFFRLYSISAINSNDNVIYRLGEWEDEQAFC